MILLLPVLNWKVEDSAFETPVSFSVIVHTSQVHLQCNLEDWHHSAPPVMVHGWINCHMPLVFF